MGMTELLTVTDVAKRLDISVDTVRRWDKRGLIKSRRSTQNHRVFNIDEVARVANQISGNATNQYRILKSKKNDLTCIDLFAGAGGTWARGPVR